MTTTITPRTFIPQIAIGLLCVLPLCGCSSDGGGPKLAAVTGRVIYKNEGVTAASIYFMPDKEKGNHGEMATSLLKEDGSFTMETYPKGNGVIPGWYKVTFDLGRRNEQDLQKFRNVKTTPISIEVTEKGLEAHLFDLSGYENEKEKAKENSKK